MENKVRTTRGGAARALLANFSGRRLRHATAGVVLGVVLGLAAGARAQDFALAIAAQDLESALIDLAQATGVQLLYPAGLARGFTSMALQGSFTPDAALSRLLDGTGLSFRYTAANTITIEQAPTDVRTLGALRVSGTQNVAAKSAAGSRDVLATENTGSYTSRGASVGSPTPEALKDTPRAISVLGQQRMQDQGISEMTSAAEQLPGVFVLGLSEDEGALIVRGFGVEQAQLDGGATFTNGPSTRTGRVLGDLSPYDRVELLRGADGLANGYSDPGGILNLVRKRPLDHAQVVVETQAGSWDRYRGMLDATSPLGLNGRLRGRAVLTGLDRDYFFDTAYKRRAAYYGIVEADLSSSTLLALGVQSYDQHGSALDIAPLPSFESGDPIDFPRDTSFILPWTQADYSSRHLFATLEQRLGQNWNARLALDREHTHERFLGAYLTGKVDETTGEGLSFFNVYDDSGFDTELADLKLSGRFELFGLEQLLGFNLNSSARDLFGEVRDASQYDDPFVDPYLFDPADYPRPSVSEARKGGSIHRTRRGGAVSLTLNPWTPLKLIAAYRWSSNTRISSFSMPDREHYDAPSYFGLSYALTDRWSAFANWADVYQENLSVVRSNGQPLEPTLGSNIETGLKYATPDASLNATVAVYRVEQKNFIRRVSMVPNSDPACCYDNDSDQRNIVEGIDAEIAGAPWPRWQLAASYNYNENHSAGGDSRNPGGRYDSFTPRHLFKLWSIWQPRPWPALRVGGGVRAQNEALYLRVLKFDDAQKLTQSFGQPKGGYAIFDALVSWQFNSHWKASLNADNVFDRVYYIGANTNGEFGVTYGTPRSFTLGLRGVW